MTDKAQPDALFTEWFAKHARGAVDRDMANAVAEVTEAVTFLDKKGTVTLTLDFERVGARAVKIAAKVRSKAPESPEASIFYLEPDGSLSKNDPEGLVMEDNTLNPAAAVDETKVAVGIGLVNGDGEVVRRAGQQTG